jgi:hypothetical protein
MNISILPLTSKTARIEVVGLMRLQLQDPDLPVIVEMA